MRNFLGVLIQGSAVPIDELLRRLDAVSAPGASHGEQIFVRVQLSRDYMNQLETVARTGSQLAKSAFFLFADTHDEYFIVSRYEDGACTRTITFDRDAEDAPQWQVTGQPESWEVDLIFALAADDFVDYLSCDDSYTDADLDRARSAHQARDLTTLARRPPLLAASLWTWLESQGVDPHTPHATVRSPSFWRRLLGRQGK